VVATVHLICGSTGSGKSTYAEKLSQGINAVVFTLDDWMAELFWPDSTGKPDLLWALERVRRCEQQMWKICREITAKKIDVILDSGFSKKEHRKKFRELAESTGIELQLHYLISPVETRRDRVRRRNLERPETFSFEVTDALFEWMESYFEPPDSEELLHCQIVET
jgi:predicted kinase